MGVWGMVMVAASPPAEAFPGGSHLYFWNCVDRH